MTSPISSLGHTHSVMASSPSPSPTKSLGRTHSVMESPSTSSPTGFMKRIQSVIRSSPTSPLGRTHATIGSSPVPSPTLSLGRTHAAAGSSEEGSFPGELVIKLPLASKSVFVGKGALLDIGATLLSESKKEDLKEDCARSVEGTFKA